MIRKYALRGAVAAALILGALAAPAAAGAAVATVTLPSTVSVGDTGVAASFALINTGGTFNVCGSEHGGGGAVATCLNGAPRAYLSCAGGDGYSCRTPDPGVFAPSGTGTGRAGSACDGVVFTLTPYANGGVLFSPPGGADFALAGGASCVIDFTVDVLKEPATDVSNVTPGVQTQHFGGYTEYAGCCGGLRSGQVDTTTVAPAGPPASATAVAVPAGGTAGQSMTATGRVTGPAPTAGETMTFNVYGPGDVACVTPVASLAATGPISAAGTATSQPYTPPSPGSYRWIARYAGGANLASASGCGDPGSTTLVAAAVAGPPASGPPPAAPSPPAAVPPPAAPAACRSDRALSVGLTLAAPTGVRLARTVIRVNGRVKQVLGRGVTRFTLRLTGYPAGVAQVILSAITTGGDRLVGTRTYRLCGYAAKPPKRLTPLHRARR